MVKKLFSLLLVMVMLVSLVSCDGSKTTSNSGADNNDGDNIEQVSIKGETFEVAVTYTGDRVTVFEEVIADFEEETDATVELATYGDDYENTLKTRMASNSLPDIFQTHGWSILRYKEYLMDLRDQPWVSLYDESALGVIQDDDDSIYVLMISQLANATLVNLDVCEEAGVDPYAIYDWDDFTEACQKIKDAGFTPIATAANNAGTLANTAGSWLNYEGAPYNETEAMLNGTYDWESYKAGPLTYLADWMSKGFYAEDVATVSDSDLQERFANNQIAFFLGNDPVWLIGAKKLNEDGNFAFIPTFAATDDSVQFVGIGEGDTFGIWKDSDNIEAAKVFLNYLTKSEVCTKINNVTGMIGAITTATENDDSYGQQLFSAMQEKYPDVFYENLWDRKYMPSGMWPIFANGAEMLFNDHSEAGVEAVKEYLHENYLDLYEAAQNN
jgi:raffinose/stachyose/melibiose transport system substrate-binding protein